MDRLTIRGALLAAAALSLTAPLAAQDAAAPPAPMSAKDLVTLPRLGAPAVNKEGTLAVYTVTTTDPDSLKRTPTPYLLDMTKAGAAPVTLKLGLKGSDFAFGPDGALYFLSSEHTDKAAAGRSRVWRVTLGQDGTAGTPQLVTSTTEADIAGFKLAPNGAQIAVWGEISRDCPTFGCADAEHGYLPGPGTGRLYDAEDGFVRHWDRWATPGVHNRIFLYALKDGVASGEGTPADGADPATGITADTPSMPSGGGEEIAFAPDGSALYFAARLSNANEPRSTNLDIYRAKPGGTKPELLTASNAATDTQPAVSPDGKYLAWLAMDRPAYEADRLSVRLMDLKTGAVRNLTEKVDLSFSSLAWEANGKSLIATAEKVLDTPAFRIDIATGKVTELNLMAGNEAHIANVVPLPKGRVLFTRDSLGAPAELFLSGDMGQARPLSDVATTRMGQMANIVTRRFSFTGANGDTVWGQITRLADQSGPIPAILYIHGGPQGSYNDSWSNRWNPRVVASQGYAVISVDFHGSTGYGQAFTDAINKNWGGWPLEDLQKGFDAAITLDTQIDGSKACAMGASYGGYMVNWIAGNWPDRFKCLVQHDGIFDNRSFYYSTEESWFPRWDYGGSYAEARETYEKWNPANHVDQWKTPMLVITGQQDFRVPYSQGLMSFTALQDRGVPAKLLVFPDENHWVLGAKNSLQWHNTVFAWLDRWLKQDGAQESASK